MTDNPCDQCPNPGCCCYFEVNIHGTRVVTQHHCEILDPATGRCMLYSRRHDIGIECLTIGEMLEHGTVPVDCPYVIDKETYKARSDRRHYDYRIEVYD